MMERDEEHQQVQNRIYSSQLQPSHIIEDTHKLEKSDNLHAFINFLSSMIGTGVLALPFAMYQCGYILGVIIIVILAYSSFESIRCLVEIVDHRSESIRIKSNHDFFLVNQAQNIHFPELILEILGKRYMVFGEICLIVYQVGSCISYIIFFSSFFKEAMLYAGHDVPLYVSILITLIILIPLVLIDNIHHLSNLGLYCLLSFLFCAIVLFSRALDIVSERASIIYYDRYFNLSGVGSFLGVAVFAFEGVGLVFHVRKSMKKRNDFNNVILGCMIISAIVYTAFGVVGVIAYGPNLNQIILINIPYDGWITTLCKVGYALGKLLCIPLLIFPCYEIFERYLYPPTPPLSSSLSSSSKSVDDNTLSPRHVQRIENGNYNFNLNESKPSKFIQFLFRIAIFVVLTGIAFIVPQFSYFLNLIGGMSGIAIQFVIPSYLYITYFFNQQKNQSGNKLLQTKIYHWIVIISGIVLSFLVTYNSLVQLI